jgi:diguanylate cyclase (GGDEF)-like protein
MRPEILIVDDDAGTIQLLGRILEAEGSLRFATSGEDALRVASAQVPDIVLLDAEMPGMSGFDVCAALKLDARLAEVPVVFITSHREEWFELAGFAAGAVDFIAKPINPKLVLARVKSQLRIKLASDELRQRATIDALTGLANRRQLDAALEQEWLRARRGRDPLALVLVDIDHFKAYNDRYGHPAGDACLRRIAETLRSVCRRPADLVARYGGEEFALLLPSTPLSGAEHVMQRLLESVHRMNIPHAASAASAFVTVSAGAAGYGADSAVWQAFGGFSKERAAHEASGTLIEAADRALYEAKHAGRDRAGSREAFQPQSSDRARDSADGVVSKRPA